MGKILSYGLIILDFIAVFLALSILQCLGNSSLECQKSVSSPISWLGVIVAFSATGFYMYRRHQAKLSTLPFKINLLAKPNVPWSYAVYYFFALIFFGENVPEIVGYLKGLPLGAPGTHASLMNPQLFFQGNSGTTINLISFAAMSLAFTVLFRRTRLIIAIAGSVMMGVLIEYVTKIGKPQGGPEGFDIYNNFWGTILTFIWLWTLLTILPYVIFSVVNRAWKTRGVISLIILMVVLNIVSYFFFRYEIYVLGNIQPGFLSSNTDILGDGVCPDKLVNDNGKQFAYKGGKGFFIKDQVQSEWIFKNCPNIQK